VTTSAVPRTGRPSWLGPLPFLAAVLVVAVLGGLAAGNASRTYQALELPDFAPPSWLFGPVWTVLYVMIGLAGWLVWRNRGWCAALVAWVVQLLLNLAWTPLFFGLGEVGLALLDISLLLGATVATIGLSWRISQPAAWLLVPYLLWVGYATALTAGIWALN
jgi:tryptophan-rich sensory protein